MKTPEMIKKGMEACSADECHGEHKDCPYKEQLFCIMHVCGDGLTYIHQLESTYSQVSKALCGKENATLDELLQAVDQLKDRLAQVERERDAMFHDLFRYGPECRTCKNNGGDYASLPCSDCIEASKISKVLRWQWRGVCPENSKEEK